MANPAPLPPDDGATRDDDALDILRRIEPMLARLDERQRKQGEDIAELKGRVAGIEKVMDARFAGVDARFNGMDARFNGIEGQLRQIPTLYQLAGLIFAIFAAAFALIRFAGH